MNPILGAVFTVIALIVGLGVGVFAGITYRKKLPKLKSARQRFRRKKLLTKVSNRQKLKRRSFCLKQKRILSARRMIMSGI